MHHVISPWETKGNKFYWNIAVLWCSIEERRRREKNEKNSFSVVDSWTRSSDLELWQVSEFLSDQWRCGHENMCMKRDEKKWIVYEMLKCSERPDVPQVTRAAYSVEFKNFRHSWHWQLKCQRVQRSLKYKLFFFVKFECCNFSSVILNFSTLFFISLCSNCWLEFVHISIFFSLG